MKKLILLLISFSCFTANAQTETTTITGTTITGTNASGTMPAKMYRATKIDSNTVVKDSAGVRYAYKDWHKMMTSGEYMLRTISRPTDSVREFTLMKMDAEAKARRRTFTPAPDESGFIKNGKKLELFNARDIEGYKIRPKELAGKVVVLNFWFISCVPCRQEIPELNKIAQAYVNDPNVVFIAVALDNKDDLQKFLKDNPFNYHIVDDGKEIANSFEIKGYPTSVILNKDGIVKFHSTGYGLNTLEDFKKTIDEAK